MLTRSLAVLVAFFLPATHTQADVWVVDAAGGGDFTEIQAAIDASMDGDTILIRPSPTRYASFDILGKGLHVSGVEGALVQVGSAYIEAVPAGMTVALSGLDLLGTAARLAAVRVLHTDATVRLTNCVATHVANLQPTIFLVRANDVTLIDCEIWNGRGIRPMMSGLYAMQSRVAVYGGSIRGADGESNMWTPSGSGSPAIHLQASLVFLQDVSVRGGDGGDTCDGGPGAGGHGLILEYGSFAAAIDTMPLPGSPGKGLGGWSCHQSFGAPGEPVSADEISFWEDLPGPIRRMRGPALVKEGTHVALRFEGMPGDELFLLEGDTGMFALTPALNGVLHLQPGAGSAEPSIGVVPPSGVLLIDVPIPTLPPGAAHQRSLLQMFARDAAGRRVAGSPAIREIISADFLSPCTTPIHVKHDALPGGDGTSWERAFASLQDGLAAANDLQLSCAVPVEVWVARGTYRPAPPGGPRTAKFAIHGGVHLLGGFAGTETSSGERDPVAHPTILSGDLLGDDAPNFGHRSDNVYHVVHLLSWSDNAIPLLDGFTVRGGHADGGGSASSGGGIRNSLGHVIRCRIEDNYAASNGAGMSGSSTFTLSIHIRDCEFIGNRAGSYGAAAASGLGYHYLNCRFSDNVIEVTSGHSGALWVSIGCRSSIANCIFERNRAAVGSALTIDANCGSDPDWIFTISNCTFVENKAADGSGAIWVRRGRVLVFNSILWGNTSDGVADEMAQLLAHPVNGELDVRYSCIQGLVSAFGPGNHGLDPLLDAELELLPGSPCIDAGSNSLVYVDRTDLDGDGDVTEPLPFDRLGRPRFVDDPAAPDIGEGTPPLVDMGAHERQIAP